MNFNAGILCHVKACCFHAPDFAGISVGNANAPIRLSNWRASVSARSSPRD